MRDHYCIHHILSGSGCYCTGTVSKHLEEGDTFILYPGVELRYQADADKPWEYAWAGFMGADAASLIRNTEFSRETPYILKGGFRQKRYVTDWNGFIMRKEIHMRPLSL